VGTPNPGSPGAASNADAPVVEVPQPGAQAPSQGLDDDSSLSGDSGLNPGFNAQTGWDDHSQSGTSRKSVSTLILLGLACAVAMYATRKRGART